MLRVCLIIDRLDLAGGPRLFGHIARGLDKKEFSVTLVSDPSSPLFGTFVEPGCALFPLPFPRPFSLGTVRALAGLFRSKRFDIVHSMGLRADFHARLAAWRTGRARVVSTVAMFAKGFDVGPVRRAVYRLAERISEARVDLFLTDSERSRGMLIAEHGVSPERVRTVYIGADPEAFRPDPEGARAFRSELGLGEGPLLGSLGRLTAQKGHDHFLSAFAEIAEEFPAAQGVVVGDGPLRDGLEAAARRLGIGDRVRFAAARRGLGPVLSALDGLVIASTIESIPVLLYEAMAAGVPVVSTSVGGIPEVLTSGENALLVPPEDPPALAEAMRTLLRSPERARALADRARTLLAEKYKVADCVSRVAAAYREVA